MKTANDPTRSRRDFPAPSVPLSLALDVVLIDAEEAAAIGGMRPSWWFEEVRTGRAPQPVVRRPRCTRWRFADVIKFWRDFADSGDADTAAEVIARATKASVAAKAKRAAQAGVA